MNNPNDMPTISDAIYKHSMALCKRLIRYNHYRQIRKSSNRFLQNLEEDLPVIQGAWSQVDQWIMKLSALSVNDVTIPEEWFKLSLVFSINFGEFYMNIGRYVEAATLFQRALDIQRQSGKNGSTRGKILCRLAQSQFYTGNHEDLRKNCLDAISLLSSKKRDKKEKSRCYALLGANAGDAGDIQGAIDNYKNALELDRETQDTIQEGIHLGALGTHTWQLGYVEEADKYFNEAIDISIRVKDRRREGTRTYNRGTLIRHIGDYPGSLSLLQKARGIAEENGDTRLQGIIDGILGECHADLGNYVDAIQKQENGLQTLRKIKYKKYLVFAEVGLGESLLLIGDYDNAIKQLLSGRALASEANMPAPQLTSNSAIARVYLHRDGDPQKALIYAEEACNYVIPLYDYFPHLLRGVILAQLGDPSNAEIELMKAFDKASGLVIKSPKLYRPKYGKGLALAGLSVLSNAESVDQLTQETIQAFHDAVDGCSVNGIISDAIKMLNEIIKFDKKNLLSPIVNYMASIQAV